MASELTGQLQPSTNNNNPVDQLMQGPLVAWVRTFHEEDEDGTLDYAQLINGAFLDHVLSRIDPRTGGRPKIQPAEDAYTRICNFDVLVRAVKGFYEDVLGQLILVRLPDPVALGRDPGNETSLAAMQTLLLLILGCAVQGPSKESVIEDIKKLPLATQHDIVNCIQQVADNPTCIWNKEWCELESSSASTSIVGEDGEEEQQQQREELHRMMVHHLRRLVHERDEYAHQITSLVLTELSSSHGQRPEPALPNRSNQQHNNAASSQSGVVVELAEAKAKIRRWRQELEEKCEQVAELREELEALTAQSGRVKQENMDLVQEARLSKALRDELDIVRERASKVDRLEAELNRYKDKLNDIDYYKARLEELREDNRLLEETKVILEGQLESARQRAELVLELESELLNCKSQLTNLLVEKEADKERLKKLAEENAHWQLCTKNCLSESASLTAELESLRASSDANRDQFANLGEQMSSVDLLGKARRLEMENQRLTALLSSNSTKESGLRGDSSERILHLEGECTRLRLRLADMDEERRSKDSQVTEMMASVTSRAAEVDRQYIELQRSHHEQKNVIESLKAERNKIDEMEMHVATLGAENQKLQRSLELFQKRTESVQNESRDLESENAKLHKTVESLRHSLRRLNDLEKENTDYESENHRLDRESKGLYKEIVRLKQAIEVKDTTLDEFSSKLSTAEREWKRLQKEADALQMQASKLRELERENKDLQQAAVVEHKTLAAIREELVQEKIRCQQLYCQLDTSVRTLELSRNETASLKCANEELALRPPVVASAGTMSSSPSGSLSDQHDILPPTIELGREVLAVKDRLVELERQNAVLLAERENLTTQIVSQKERLNETVSQLAVLSQQLATLQVENSTLASQLDSVTTQSCGLQTSLTLGEAEREKLAAQLLSSEARLERMSGDQQELQKLHEQLQSEYDALLGERELLKTYQRESKSESRALHDQLAASAQAEHEWQQSRTEMQDEVEKLRVETRSLNNLRSEHSRLKDDFRSLFVANEKLKGEYKNLQSDYKGLRVDHNALKLKHTQLQGEAAECKHQVTNLDVELGKLNNKCDVLQQWNTTLEEDKRNLVNQVSVLLTQYHELLSQTLEEKDHFHEETKNFSDRLNNLKRQKEILEDKIMEQYRRMENCPSGGGGGGHGASPFKKSSKASIGALFVRKMRRASSELISRVPRSRSRNRVGDMLPAGDRASPDHIDGHLDTSSLESGSQSSSNSDRCGSLDGGSGCEGDLTGNLPPSSTPATPGVIAANVPNAEGVTWEDRDHPVRQSAMQTAGSQRHNTNQSPSAGSPVLEPVSTKLGANSQNAANQLNGNLLYVPPSILNGNLDVMSTPTPSPRVNLECQLAQTQAATSTTSSYPNATPVIGSFSSAAPHMMMSPMAPLPIGTKVQPSARINGGYNANNGSAITPTTPPTLPRFHQPTRSLALLERAGSRQPLCLSEIDPALAALPDETSLGFSQTIANPLPLSMRPRNISPASFESPSISAAAGSPVAGSNKSSSSSSNSSINSNNNKNNNNNSGNNSVVVGGVVVRSATPALVQNSTTGTNPTTAPFQSASPTPNIVPQLTSTTRINVNISTAAVTPLRDTSSLSSPVLPPPLLERRGSLRLTPRPAARSFLADLATGTPTPPLLPARAGNNQERPVLPPRPTPSANTPSAVDKLTVEDGNNGAPPVGAGASSIWYEYGCV